MTGDSNDYDKWKSTSSNHNREVQAAKHGHQHCCSAVSTALATASAVNSHSCGLSMSQQV